MTVSLFNSSEHQWSLFCLPEKYKTSSVFHVIGLQIFQDHYDVFPKIFFLSKVFSFLFSFLIFIYLFIYGCVGSSFLCEGFL